MRCNPSINSQVEFSFSNTKIDGIGIPSKKRFNKFSLLTNFPAESRWKSGLMTNSPSPIHINDLTNRKLIGVGLYKTLTVGDFLV